MNKFFIAICVLSCVGMSAQTRMINSANKLYNEQSYSEAIPKYERIMKKDSNNAVVLAKLGDCYRLTNNTKGQILCYGKLVSNGTAEPVQKLYYGKALMESGRYDEAKKYMDEYTADNRGQVFSKAISNLKAYSKNEDAYRVLPEVFNSPDNDFAAVLFNGTTIVFTSSRTKTRWINRKHGWTGHNYTNLYSTEIGSKGKYLKPRIFMKDLKSKYNDGPVCFSKDGQTVFFTRNNSGGKKAKSAEGTYKLQILAATLNRDGFERVTLLPFNNKDYNCAHPCVSADGNTMYFASDMPGGQGGMDIYVSKKDESTGIWGMAENMGDKINTKGNEMFPFIINNLLYFSSDGHEGLGGLDIYEVKLKPGKVGKIYNMGKPVNSEMDDFTWFLREDGKSGFFSSNRASGDINDDIYTVDVLRDVKRGKEVKIVTKDRYTNEVIPATALKMNAEETTTNDKGEYDVLIEEDINYALSAKKEKYYDAVDSLSTKTSEADEFTKEILMDKDPESVLLAFVTDAKTNMSLSDVKITITDSIANAPFDTYTTTATGEYRKALPNRKFGDKLGYKIVLEKKGYLKKTLNFNTEITASGEIKIHEKLDMKLSKIELGIDLGKLANLNPIYFDIGKFNITPAASVELDKIVKVMNDYPGMVVELGSHTDCRDAAAKNLALSDKRAKASAAYIVSKGIAKGRIFGKGYGEKKLLNGCGCEGKIKSNCSEEEHAKNRRTEFIVTKYKEPVVAAPKPAKPAKKAGKGKVKGTF